MVEDEVFIVESVGGVDEKAFNTSMDLVGRSSNVESVHSKGGNLIENYELHLVAIDFQAQKWRTQ
jgi:hypothetical protein